MLLKCIQAGGPLITLPLGTGCWQMFCGAHQAAQHWKDKQGSVCSILGGLVAVGILSLPIPGQPGLTTILEWKALSLSWLMTSTPRLSSTRNILWLNIVVKKVLSKNLSRARAASRTGENRCWQRLWATSSCP